MSDGKSCRSIRRHPKVVSVQNADENHLVVTFVANGGAYCVKPCMECPWRKDAPIGAFPAEAYRVSANTAYDGSFHKFACHMAGTGHPKTCAGFLLQNADNNLGVRIAQIRGDIDLARVSDGGHRLYENYRAMAEANGVAPDDPTLTDCRGNFDVGTWSPASERCRKERT